MHVALNVPEPEEPLVCVTAQLKFTHESASDPDDPGSDCVVAHVPVSASDAGVVVVVTVGLVRLLKMSHAALATEGANRTAKMIVRRMIFLQGLPRPSAVAH